MKLLQNYITNYIDYCQQRKHLDRKTLKAYRIDLNQYETYIADDVEIFSKNTVDSYITKLHSLYKTKTVKRKIASLKAFFHYLIYREIISDNPFSHLDIHFREAKLLPKTLPFHTMQSFFYVMYQQKSKAQTEYQLHCCIRDIAVVELLFATGVRISELCSLKPNDIDLKTGNVLIYGKGAKERILQIGNPDVIAALNLYKETFANNIAESNCFFINRFNHQFSAQSVRFMINKYAKLANIEQHITPHTFRHTFATLLLEQDVDIRYIQRMLGHSSISTTEIYTHVSNVKQKDILFHKHPRNLMEVDKG